MRYELTAKRIREAMRDMNMTQQELADKSGIGKSSISHYVNGSNEPGNKSAYNMAKVLNVNPAWIMGLDAPKKTQEAISIDFIKDNLNIINENSLKETRDAILYLYNEALNNPKETYNKVIGIDKNEKALEIQKALELYKLYEKADPRIKAAVESLLKGPQ